ncbi:MAG TPA: hypothetical protein PL126_07070 [Candidatus Cloacimonadota bacterium]|nr:hypothetical protein [Candidatus Cloacimonadota bacterium]
MRYKLMSSKEMALSFKALYVAMLRSNTASVNSIHRLCVSKLKTVLLGSPYALSLKKGVY